MSQTASSNRDPAQGCWKRISKAPLSWFFVLAFLLSWCVTIPMVYLQGSPRWTILATFGPACAALVVNRATTGRFRFSISPGDSGGWIRTLWSTVAAVALVVTAYVVLPGIVTADPNKLNWSILLSLQVFNYSTLLGGPVGEEIGWTGFAHKPMQERFGELPGVLLLGLLWALWHIPMFLKPGFYSTPFWVFTIMMLGLRVLIGTCVNWSAFNTGVAIAAHAAFNTVSRWLGGLYGDVQPESALPLELVMALSGLAIAAILVLATRRTLGFPRPEGDFPPK